MIFPGNFSDLREKPSLKLSWVVLFLNVIIYLLMTLFFEVWPSREIGQDLVDSKFKKSVVEMYIQTLDGVEKKNLKISADGLYVKALKDQKFWSRIESFPFKGDQVQINLNRKIITQFYKSYLSSTQFQFGLGSFEASPWSWVTYQFVHASFLHLLGNVLLIFLIISYLEKNVSSVWIAGTYLMSGFWGGISFLCFDTFGGMSVVGASASASGLLGFLLATKATQLMPWGFLWAPVNKGFGQIYLPVFFIFPIFLVSDFVSLLAEPTGVAANVAISAHVGGACCGFLTGLGYLLFRSKATPHRVFSDNNGFHELS